MLQIFGPVQQILRFSSLNEAITRANASEYGLAAAVFTKDIDKANYIVQGLRAGTVWYVRQYFKQLFFYFLVFYIIHYMLQG